MTEAIVVKDEHVSIAVTPMRLLEIAMSKDADLDKLAMLMDLQIKWESNEARKAFTQAMADFKNEPIVIVKDKTNAQYKSKYSSIGSWVNTVTPFLSKYGLSAEWTLDQSKGIRVGCRITHSLGHSGEWKWMDVPADTSGAKNPLQQIKSSTTYARIVTFEMATGLASDEANLDDDGNASGKRQGLSEESIADRIKLIEAAATQEKLEDVWRQAHTVADKAGDTAAVSRLLQSRDKRRAELRAKSASDEPKVSVEPPKRTGERLAEHIVVERLDWIENAATIEELQKTYDAALKMARQVGDKQFEANLLAAAKKQAEKIAGAK